MKSESLSNGPNKADHQPLVSIIIPTRDAGKVLRRCLDSIQSQSYRNFEIIVVDNYSCDETVNIAKRYGAKIITAGPPPPRNNFFTAPIQRKVGALHASGDFLFFVDADMILLPDTVKECVEKCLRGGANAVIVPEVSVGKGFWSNCKILERNCYRGDSAIEAPRFVERSVYEYVGGWRDVTGGLDDWDLMMRLKLHGAKIIRTEHFILHDEGFLTLRRLFQKKFNMGKSSKLSDYLMVDKAKTKDVIFQLTPLRLLTLLWGASRLGRNPLEILGLILMKIVEGVAFYMGVLLKATN